MGWLWLQSWSLWLRSASPGATAGALAARGSVPQPLGHNGREGERDYVAEQVNDGRWTSQKSRGGQAESLRSSQGQPRPREHRPCFSICIPCQFKRVPLDLQTASRWVSAAVKTHGILKKKKKMDCQPHCSGRSLKLSCPGVLLRASSCGLGRLLWQRSAARTSVAARLLCQRVCHLSVCLPLSRRLRPA